MILLTAQGAGVIGNIGQQIRHRDRLTRRSVPLRFQTSQHQQVFDDMQHPAGLLAHSSQGLSPSLQIWAVAVEQCL